MGQRKLAMRTVFPQDAEPELKRAFFAGTGRGYFVEVGANQPREASQTFDLEQRGWTGVLIEPRSDCADELRRQRTARVFAEACSSRRNAGGLMTLHLAGGHSSFDARLDLAAVKPHGAVVVPVRTLDEILIEAQAPAVDFVSIDVEGHELDVLDGFDLARWQLHLRLHRYLQQAGYRWMRRTGINNWYVPASRAPSLGLDGHWQFFSKVYTGTPLRRIRTAWRRWLAVPRFVDRPA
jgi:FkbM family methyltransferase